MKKSFFKNIFIYLIFCLGVFSFSNSFSKEINHKKVPPKKTYSKNHVLKKTNTPLYNSLENVIYNDYEKILSQYNNINDFISLNDSISFSKEYSDNLLLKHNFSLIKENNNIKYFKYQKKSTIFDIEIESLLLELHQNHLNSVMILFNGATSLDKINNELTKKLGSAYKNDSTDSFFIKSWGANHKVHKKNDDKIELKEELINTLLIKFDIQNNSGLIVFQSPKEAIKKMLINIQ